MSKRSRVYLLLVMLVAVWGRSHGRQNPPGLGRHANDDAMVGGGGFDGGGQQREESQAAIMQSRALRTAKGREMLGHMNTTADPCKDFYEYACGQWIGDFRRKLTEEAARNRWQARNETSVVDELQLKVIGQLQSLLQAAAGRDDSKGVLKVKHFYRSCMAAERASTAQQDFMVQFAKRAGGLPGVPRTRWNNEEAQWIKEIATLRYRYGMDILIGLEYKRDLHRNNMRSYYITEPTDTLIPAQLCNMEALRRGALLRDEAYDAIKREVAENMRNWFGVPDNRANVFASEIVRFEFELCKGMRSTRPEEAYPQPQQLYQLNEEFQGIDFKLFVDTSLNTSLNDEVYLRHESYFRHLREQVRQSARPTMANYIMYRALLKFHLANDRESKARALHCVELAGKYFPRIVGDMYNRHHQRPEAKKSLRSTFTTVLETFHDALKSGEWLKDTKVTQYRVLRSRLNFPAYDDLESHELRLDSSDDFWHTLEAVMQYYTDEVRSNADDDAQSAVKSPDVQMQYVADKSEVISGLGLLQPPFYHHSYGQSLRYSVLGHWMAKALSSAFLAQGWADNGGGAGHWNEYTLDGFRNRSECFRQQYSNYLHNNPDEFRNLSKVAELMADSSALNIAFGAYVNWLQTVPPHQGRELSKETLPGLNYSNTQLFFIHFAQSRCTAKRDEEWPPEFFPLDRHTPERYNVNGHLANNEEFAREFGCPLGSAMNQADKCAVYS